MALVAWVALAVVFDFAAIALLQFTGDGEPGPVLLRCWRPIRSTGCARSGWSALGADVLLGPAGAALAKLLGPSGGAARPRRPGGLVCRPLACAARVYRRRDF